MEASYYDWDTLAAARARGAYDGLTGRAGARTRLLVSDIDDTLVGDRDAVARFRAWREDAADCWFAIATGRRLAKAIEVLREWRAPLPDVLITAVGTEIHLAQDGNLGLVLPDHVWTRRISQDWPRRRLAEVLDDIPDLEWQAASEQRTHKLSFILEKPARVADIRSALAEAGLAANVIYSHERYLDVLPENASKGRAVRHLAARLGIDLDQVITAGDSGNDLDMLRAAGGAIVVGNASAELDVLRDTGAAYFARQDYAAGILEGVEALWGG